MKKIKYSIVLLFILFPSYSFALENCDILIHGFSFKESNSEYFGDFPNQVIWNSSQEIEFVAPRVADQIQQKIDACPHSQPIVLRPHSYGAALVHYILGKGNLFQDAFPEHPYVKIYKRVSQVYAFTGAYHGTPLMDLVCANRLTRAIIQLMGTSCVRSLSTSEVDNVANKVSSAGVPTHLIYSTKSSGYMGATAKILNKHLVTSDDYSKGVRNQNDNTLPLYAAKACITKKVMKNAESKCDKIDPNYMEDFFHTDQYAHLQFRKIKDFIYMTKQ